ncbi:MAG: hypothetical protein WD136_04970 [Cyanobium sp.]
MDCLHPTISERLSLLVVEITPARRQAVLDIARAAPNWQVFQEVLQRGGFPLPETLRNPLEGEAAEVA